MGLKGRKFLYKTAENCSIEVVIWTTETRRLASHTEKQLFKNNKNK
jgi:hypothetical protein